MSSLGPTIATMREEKGRQSKYVASIAEISWDRYSRIETGKLFPTDKELISIAFALDSDVTDIVRRWEAQLILAKSKMDSSAQTI